MNLPILDLVVIGVVLISALLAMVRGLTREVLAIVAWVTAIVAAWMLHPVVAPFAAQYIANPTIALVAAIAGVFLVTLIVVSLITVKISDFILDSRIGAIDRTLGFVFGAARGFLICAIGFIFFQWLVASELPEWAENARTRASLQSTGDWIIAKLPEDPEGVLEQFRSQQQGDPGEPADAAPLPNRG